MIHRAAVFWLLTPLDPSAPVVRAWSGVGPFALPPDAADPTGGVYEGLGPLAGLPVLSKLANGQADRVEFSLAGVDEESVRLVNEAVDEVKGAAIRVGVAELDDAWQPVGGVVWWARLRADVISVGRTPEARRVSISAGDAFTGRRRPTPVTYTPVTQRRRSPTDAFCDRVPSYNAGHTVRWPN